MGFRGKASQGCHACRMKKTRCDQLRPGCTQCKRAKRVCPGYRIMGDLVFRDETAKVQQKCNAQKRKNSTLSKDDCDSFTSTQKIIHVKQSDQRSLTCSSLSSKISPTLEEQATGLFIANFVNGKNGPSRGHMEYFEDLYQSEELGRGLIAGMKAVGCAVYAHRANAPYILQIADYHYGQAIHHTRKSLTDPIDARKNSTIVGIIVLGIYETVVGKKSRSTSSNWIRHFNGAAALIKLRGSEQIKTMIGLGILVTVCRNLLIAGIQHAFGLPQHLRDYMNMALTVLRKEDDNPSFDILDAMMLFSDIRVDFVNDSVSKKELLRRLEDLDEILTDITDNHPSSWDYEILQTDVNSPSIFKGHYHLYSDLRVAQIWNMLRTLRIMITQMISDILKNFISKATFPSYEAQLSKALETLRNLQFDILYSVPQHIGVFSSRNIREISCNYRGFGVPMSGSWYLCWPLWLTAILDNTTQEIRDFVIYNLRNISKIGGIGDGDTLADMLESNPKCDKMDLYDRIRFIAKMGT